MTPYRFRVLTAGALFLLLAFAVLAFGAVDLWALMVLEIGIFAVSAFWVVRVALGQVAPARNPFYWPLGLIVIWTAAQYQLGFSVYPYRTKIEGLKWLALFLLFALAAQVFTDPSIRSGFQLALVWFGFGLCVFGLVQHFASPGLMYWSIPILEGKMFGPFVNANHFAALLELMVPAALLLALQRPEQRLIYIAVCGMILTAAVVCASRAGIVVIALETLIVLGTKTLTTGRQKALGRAALALGTAAAMAAIALAVSRSQDLMDRFQEEQPYQVRWSVVEGTWRLFLSRPWTGFGAGTFDQVYPSAASLDMGLFWPHAHNDPVQFAMEWGVMGLAALGWILLLLLRRWPQDTWLAVVLPVLAVLAHSWVDFPFQIPAIAAAWLLTLAMLNPSGGSRILSNADTK